jgi:hypothetical protein
MLLGLLLFHVALPRQKPPVISPLVDSVTPLESQPKPRLGAFHVKDSESKVRNTTHGVE